MPAFMMVKDSYRESPLPSGMTFGWDEMRSMLRLKTITPGSIVKSNGKLLKVCKTSRGAYQLISMEPSQRKSRYKIVKKAPVISTPREREVLMLMVQDVSTKEMAMTLGIGMRTVMAHVGAVKEKLDVCSREGAVGQAFAEGILTVVDRKVVFADEVK